jgi:hypothetical protein
MNKFTTLLLACFALFAHTLYAASKTSAGSGDWNSSSTWTPAGVPAAGDVVTIASGHTVTVTNVVNMSSGNATTITVEGILRFNSSGSKLRLAAGSVIQLNSGGQIQTDGNGGGSSQTLEIGGSTVWSTSMGNFTGPRTVNQTNPLPVSWLSFTGTRMPDGSAQLNWSTASELNNSHFEVEKTTDGKNFTKVGEVKGNGTTNKISKYAYTDKTAGSATVYYRLKQVDFNTKFEYSKLVAVKGTGASSNNSTTGPKPGGSTGGNPKGNEPPAGGENLVSIKPAVVRDIALIQVKGHDKADIILEVVNQKGQVVDTRNSILFNGTARVDYKDLPKGIYKIVVRLASDKKKLGGGNIMKK